MFYGESMFTRSTDASKIALATWWHLTAQGVALIDCQQQTHHLASLGARPIARSKFLQHVRRHRAAVAGLDARLAGQRRHASARPRRAGIPASLI